MVLDLNFGAKKLFTGRTTGYALVMEAIYEFPINQGCIVYAEFKDERLLITKNIIDEELRERFIEERDEKMRKYTRKSIRVGQISVPKIVRIL